jgi:hypothetical protein
MAFARSVSFILIIKVWLLFDIPCVAYARNSTAFRLPCVSGAAPTFLPWRTPRAQTQLSAHSKKRSPFVLELRALKRSQYLSAPRQLSWLQANCRDHGVVRSYAADAAPGSSRRIRALVSCWQSSAKPDGEDGADRAQMIAHVGAPHAFWARSANCGLMPAAKC